MKKILFASTALVATAGVAAAEVTFGGFGRFGVYHQETNDADVEETRLEQRLRLDVRGITETDGGVKFEGHMRFQSDDAAGGAGNVAQSSGAEFSVSSGGLRVDIGNTSDVLDSSDVVDYFGYGVGLTSFGENSSGFGLPASGFGVGDDDSGVRPTVKVKYEVGDFTVSASVTDNGKLFGSTTDVLANSITSTTTESEEYQIGFGYNFGNYSAGIAFGSEEETVSTVVQVAGAAAGAATTATTDRDFAAASFGGDLGAFGFSILIADIDGRDTSWGISGKYDISAATQLRAVIGDNGVETVGADTETYAIGFRHSLGGGVSLQGGIGEVAGATTGDLGVRFDF